MAENGEKVINLKNLKTGDAPELCSARLLVNHSQLS